MVYTNNYCISINYNSINNEFSPFLIRVEKEHKARFSETESGFVVSG